MKPCVYRLNCIGGCAEEAGLLDGIIQRSGLIGEIIEWWKKIKSKPSIAQDRRLGEGSGKNLCKQYNMTFLNFTKEKGAFYVSGEEIVR